MRLTFQGTETETSGAYNCTTINATDMGGAACTMPMPGAIVQGPAEIFYGAYSIWCEYNNQSYIPAPPIKMLS